MRAPSGREFLKACDLLPARNKMLAIQTLENFEHTVKLYGVYIQPRQLAAIAARLHLPNYDDKTVADEFVMGVSALTSKMAFLNVLHTNVDSLLMSKG